MDFCQIYNDFMGKSNIFDDDNLSFDDNFVAEICKHLVNITNTLKNSENREMISLEVVTRICSCFRTALSQTCTLLNAPTCQEGAALSGLLQMSTEGARCLRNACAGCQRNQQLVASHPSLLQALCHIIEMCCKYVKSSQSSVIISQVHVLLRCCVQMLGNYSAGNPNNGKMVWKDFFKLFSGLFSCDDTSLSTYTCMLIHSCSLAEPVTHLQQMVVTPTGQQLICDILEFLTQSESEWGLYVMEWTLTHPGLLTNIWNDLKPPKRNLLLDILLTQLSKSHDQTPASQEPEQAGTSDVTVAMETVEFVCGEFKDKAHTILGLHKGHVVDPETAVLVTKQLEIICIVTAESSVYGDIINDNDLLKVTINLLHSMQMLGDKGDNMFSNMSKLSEIQELEDTSNPISGLKRDLIRLISNMAHKNKHNQDLVRELGGISLILDHTNIDGRNPFITQWSIFAIHNLLEGNHSNQELVSAMRLEGLSNNVDQLREFGVEADLDGDRIRVRNVKSDQGVLPFSKPQGKPR